MNLSPHLTGSTWHLHTIPYSFKRFLQSSLLSPKRAFFSTSALLGGRLSSRVGCLLKARASGPFPPSFWALDKRLFCYGDLTFHLPIDTGVPRSRTTPERRWAVRIFMSFCPILELGSFESMS